MILEWVLSTPASTAPDIEKPWSLTQGREKYKLEALSTWSNGNHVYLQDSPLGCPPFLLVNRQLYEEVRLALTRIEATYVLDIIILNEFDVILTWLLISKPSLCVSNLICNFRIATNPNENIPPEAYRGYHMGERVGPAMVWTFYILFELFFLNGPRLKSKKPPLHTKPRRSIRRLTINVETPPGVAPERFGPPSSRRRCLQDTNEPANHVLDPEYLVNFIKEELEGLLRMGYHTAEYGDILYVHLDAMVIQRDGNTLHVFDVTERLKEFIPTYLDAGESREARIAAFQNWRIRAWPRRRELGLDVPEGVDIYPRPYMRWSECFHGLYQF